MTDLATIPAPGEINGPGVYSIPEAEYHARPEMSSTGLRKLLPPSCPALFQHWRENAEPRKKAWDIGTAAHKLVLGVGPKLEVVEGDGKLGPEVWNTDKVRARVAEVRDGGGVPLKPSEFDTVQAMAAKLREHPVASALFQPGAGRGEQTLIWRDQRTGVECRALLDWLEAPTGRRFLLRDYKSGRTAAPDKLGRTIADYGYHVQLAHYLAGCRALGLAGDDAQALLVVQETSAPYLVTVSQPDPTAMRLGAIRVREALDLYAECQASGRWPGYSDEVVLTELPAWETRELDGAVW